MGLNYCINCEQFPCKIVSKKLFSSHKDDPRYTYRYEIPDTFARLKNLGVASYLEFQKQRWRCSSCGGTIQFYLYKCNKCGKEHMIK